MTRSQSFAHKLPDRARSTDRLIDRSALPLTYSSSAKSFRGPDDARQARKPWGDSCAVQDRRRIMRIYASVRHERWKFTLSARRRIPMPRLDGQLRMNTDQAWVLDGEHAVRSIAQILSRSHFSRIRHATEELLLFQHFSSHTGLHMRLSVQLMQNEPEPDFQPHARQLQDLPQQQLPQVSVRNRVAIVAVSRFSWSEPTVLLPDFNPVCDAFHQVLGVRGDRDCCPALCPPLATL